MKLRYVVASFAFATTSPIFAAEARAQSAGAACKVALKDLAFREQMAMTDGSPSPYANAPRLEACKAGEAKLNSVGPIFAAEAPAQSADAACKEALRDLALREQMAMSDGGPSLYASAPQPAVCKAKDLKVK
jgi:hypothetical protein